MANLNKVIYLTEEQKEALFTNGTLTVNGQTITYNDNDIYITMDRTGQGKAHIVNETVTPLATISGLVEGQTYYSGDYFTVSCEQPCSVGISFDKEEHYMELIAYPIKGVSNTYKFQLPELLNDFTIGIVLLGDINKDGAIDLKDSSMVLQYLSNNTSLSALSLLALDLNRNGIIDTDDATLIQQYYSRASSFQWNVVNSDIIPIPEKNQAGKILVATNNNKYELQDAPTGGGSSSSSGANWEEDDSTASSYIQNKPPIKAGSHAEHPGIIEGMIEDEDYYDEGNDEDYHADANSASGEYAHAEGYSTKAIGDMSHSEGYQTQATVYAAHAEGEQTIASGFVAHAEGRSTTASGDTSHAEGQQTTASRQTSHAEGFGTTASGQTSHAEGIYTTASARGSHAEGDYTTAASVFQHVQGKYNIIDNQNIYADIVGNGTSASSRSNAYTLDWNGNGWFAGTVEASAILLRSSTPNSTKVFRITVDDTGVLTTTEVQ